MCLIISVICFALAYNFYEDGNLSVASINLIIGIFFALLMLRNILKTKKREKKVNPNHTLDTIRFITRVTRYSL